MHTFITCELVLTICQASARIWGHKVKLTHTCPGAEGTDPWPHRKNTPQEGGELGVLTPGGQNPDLRGIHSVWEAVKTSLTSVMQLGLP